MRSAIRPSKAWVERSNRSGITFHNELRNDGAEFVFYFRGQTENRVKINGSV